MLSKRSLKQSKVSSKSKRIDLESNSTSSFYERKLKDGAANFEIDETTCSHILKSKNGFLRGKSYGEAIFEKLSLKKNVFSILEIGAGKGDLAFDILTKAKEGRKKPTIKYHILDISPELIKIQKRKLKQFNVQWFNSNAEKPFPISKSQKFDFIIANEMIADLKIDAVKNIRSGDTAIDTLISDFYNGGRGPIYYPSGLINMLSSIRNYCDSKSKIFISEYFTRHGPGHFVPLKGHREFKFNLSFVAELTRCLGFQVSVSPLVEFLNMNLNFKPVSREYTKLLADRLELIDSRNALIKEEALSKISPSIRIQNVPSLLSRAEWIGLFSNYYFLTLSYNPTMNSNLESENGLIKKNLEYALIKKGNFFYLTSIFPSRFYGLTNTQANLWLLLDKKKKLKELVKAHPEYAKHLLQFKLNNFIL